jgi:hypothetical protein
MEDVSAQQMTKNPMPGHQQPVNIHRMLQNMENTKYTTHTLPCHLTFQQSAANGW